MNNSEWITDRRPTREDADYLGCVWTTIQHNGEVALWSYVGIAQGQPWMPIAKPEPYVEPKRYTTLVSISGWAVFDTTTDYYCADCIPSREAAEEIAAVYERTMQ